MLIIYKWRLGTMGMPCNGGAWMSLWLRHVPSSSLAIGPRHWLFPFSGFFSSCHLAFSHVYKSWGFAWGFMLIHIDLHNSQVQIIDLYMVGKRRFSASKWYLVCKNQLRIEATGAVWKFILNILLEMQSWCDFANDVNIAMQSCCTSCKRLIY